jgi:hypothetical protein
MSRMLLPRAALGKGLIVLTAYFDDSGTHAGSPVVSTGGLYGNDSQWETLEREWKAILDSPGDGWPRLRRFHMYDCVHGEGEFFGHTLGARDHLIYKFRQTILKAGLHGYSMAVSGPDWDRLVAGVHRDAWGDGERFSVLQCFLRTLDWASRESVETEAAFVFDDRPQRREANERVFRIYQNFSAERGLHPKPVGIAFLNSEKTIPLQAADMFAWESNRFSLQWLREGNKAVLRAHFRRFLETRRFQMQCASSAQIEEMINKLGGRTETLEKIANYFNAPTADLSLLARRPEGAG